MAAAPLPQQRRRAAVLALAACLLSLASGASAQLTCGAGYFRLDLIRTTSVSDAQARCLTSVQVNLYSDCKVSLAPLNVAGNFVPAIWTGLPSKTYERYVECPLDEGTSIPTLNSASAINVQAAIRRAFEGHVYGFDGNLTARSPHTLSAISPIVITPGLLTLNRASGVSLDFAVTEVSLPFPFQVSSTPNLTAVDSCSQLPSRVVTCIDNSVDDGIANACAAGRYGIEINMDLKVCALCPAGSFGDTGHGCSACPAGVVSDIGSASCTTSCDAGRFAPQGASTCQPCLSGTYSEGIANEQCMECPSGSNSWIPGSAACLRCINGIPVSCTGGNTCAIEASPGSHIVTVGQMQTCGLNGTYEVKSYTKCSSWSQLAPATRVQFALEVAGDCSIDIKPIADPACADPTSATGFSFGAIQMRAYYADTTTIRSLVPSDSLGGPMLSIEPSAAADGLTWTFWAATQDAADSGNTQITGGTTCVPPTPTVVGGQLVGKPLAAISQCPARSYYVPEAYCYACPVGSWCPGGSTINSGPKPLCAPMTYNNFLGASACLACPIGGNATYAGATQCDIPVLDQDCFLANHGNIGKQYDPVSQTCMLCPAGTRRDDTLKRCVDCPAGFYSGHGAANCTICPAGQYNPSPGLANQVLMNNIPGQHCFLCPRGSLSLSGSQTAATVVAGQITAGATFCDACPPGFVQNVAQPLAPCVPCASSGPMGPYTYRTGDATPENNECVKIPSGYTLKATTGGVVPNTELDLCAPGTISYWSSDGLTRTPNNQFACIGCADLTPAANFSHMYAPHAGMSACIACPAGTIPVTTGSPGSYLTASCAACPDGFYRDAYTESSTCLKCGVGKEVGRTQGQECTQCWPGSFMNAARIATNASYCAPCARNAYKASYGATECDLCPRGYATQDEGNIECSPCPIGFYSVAGGNCLEAPAGTFVNSTAAFFFTACPEGTWNDEKGLDNCNSCSPGKYSNTEGSTECKTCPAGTYSVAQATSCIDCRAGYAAPAGSGRCHPCKPGTFTETKKSNKCKPCQRGFQCPTSAMSRPGGCPRGTFSNKEGNRMCTPCPINTISSGSSQITPTAVLSCRPCPAGTNTRGLVGQSRCMILRPQVRRLLETETDGSPQ